MTYDINEYPYFVMLHLENSAGKFLGLLMKDEDDDVVYFSSYDEAEKAAKENSLGAHFGYEIFQHGCGE